MSGDRHSPSANGTEGAPSLEIGSRDLIAMGTVLARKLNWAVRSTWQDRMGKAIPRKQLDFLVDKHTSDILAELSAFHLTFLDHSGE